MGRCRIVSLETRTQHELWAIGGRLRYPAFGGRGVPWAGGGGQVGGVVWAGGLGEAGRGDLTPNQLRNVTGWGTCNPATCGFLLQVQFFHPNHHDKTMSWLI